MPLSVFLPTAKALLVVALAAGTRIFLDDLLGTGSPFMLFFPAVMLISWRWGRIPGLASVAASAACVSFVWFSPRWSFSLSAPGEIAQLILFCLIASYVSHFLQRLSAMTGQISLNEQRYKSLVRSTVGFVWITDAQGVSKVKPEQWEEITGRQTYQQGDWARMIDPEDMQGVLATFAQATKEKRSYQAEFKMLSKEGNYRWFATRGVPILAKNNEVVEWVGLTYEIHAAKTAEAALVESERRLRIAAELAGLSVFDWTPPNGALNCDARLKTMWGLSVDATADFSVFSAAIDPRDEAFVRERMKQAINPHGNGSFEGEFRVIGINDKLQRWVGARGQMSFIDGKPASFVGAALEITERKRAEEKLETAVTGRTAELRATIAELEAFSYSISHDLRGPLRAMQSFAQALREDCGAEISAVGKDYIRRIVSAAERMDRIIQDVLVYSRVSRADLVLEPVPLDEFIRSLLEAYPSFHDSRADFTIEGPLPVVRANQAALTQCLANLIGNATKFVAPGVRPAIRIFAKKIGGRAFISIQDNGIGIPKRAHEAIFGIFYRLDQSYEGTGIGLAIVQKGVERMGGRISVESEPEKGSTFTFDLPLVENS